MIGSLNRKVVLLSLGIVGLTAISCTRDSIPTAVQTERGLGAQARDSIPGEYIVLFRSASNTSVADRRALAAASGAAVFAEYDGAIRGFAARMAPQAAEALRRNPRVLSVGPNLLHSLAHHDAWQAAPSWGLDRINQRNRPVDGSFSYDLNRTGSGVRIYIIDSGIEAANADFGGRVLAGTSTVLGDPSSEDNLGHGTRVASAAAGTVYGVAKGAWLVPVRITSVPTNIPTSQIIAGVNWVANNHVKPAVANMSLSGPADISLDNAVIAAIATGVAFTVAAGNDNGLNACNLSPAKVTSAITVGATKSTDARASFSNTGPCLDIFAPGEQVVVSQRGGGSATVNGTSYAAPMVAGAIAQYLQGDPFASVATVTSSILSNATGGKVTSLGISGTPNRLLFSAASPHFNSVQQLAQDQYPHIGILLRWNHVPGVSEFHISLVTEYRYYDDYSGTSSVYDVSSVPVGVATDTAIVDFHRVLTGSPSCFINQTYYWSESYMYYYEFTPIFGPTTRLPALVAQNDNCVPM